MKENLYIVTVSFLNVRKDPKIDSNINLTKDTVVQSTGKTKTYRKDEWIEVITLSEPKVMGYVSKKCLRKI